ncbi:C45 family autoproteolytic acyltransferase/hydolase [Tomitella gaofuii]|uniref:C45 family autoproteolytic acyltransferase/hydolase n=1 Tax=Tomitella gaofuii TaxID=2760083 RepID=UPI0015F92E07|nr:C45 family peptidase [Tomitella gaofuii]
MSGPREAAFRALGERCAGSIAAVQESMPERDGLRRFASSDRGRSVLGGVTAATREAEGDALADLRALAEGAGRRFEDLLLANFRGDLGYDDGTGCTDLAWSRSSAFVAHNEDGAPSLDGHLRFVTLALDGEPSVTAQWYPGFLPSNAWCVNEHGLAWGINHVQVASPAVAAGRHFVARGLQCVRDLDEAADYLRTHPIAGGFTFTLGAAPSGRSVTVESAAGRVEARSPQAGSPLVWHTNHLRFLPDSMDTPAGQSLDQATSHLGLYDESQLRGSVLGALAIPGGEPDVAWFEQVLCNNPVPCGGVRRDAEGDDPLATLCTTIVDLHAGIVHVRSPHGAADVDMVGFARGEA